jgi:hypothetical protein
MYTYFDKKYATDPYIPSKKSAEKQGNPDSQNHGKLSSNSGGCNKNTHGGCSGG